MKTEDILYLLLRVALFKREADFALASTLSWSEVRWEKLYAMAKAQGVAVLVFDGISAVMQHIGDASLGMPRSLKMRWLSMVDVVEKRFVKQNYVAMRVANICRDEQIKALIFKGLVLARLYPNPQHRECGDLDIYVFDNQRKLLDKAILNAGGKWISVSEKHSELMLNGVIIENHNCFAHRYLYSKTKWLNRRLLHYSQNAEQFIANTPLYASPLAFDVLFVLYHAANHFKFEGITLRHIIDWCFVVKNANYNIAEINKLGLEKFSSVLCRIGKQYLGFDLPDNLCCCEDVVYERVLSDVVHSDISKNEDKVGFASLIWLKFRRFTSRRWAYKLVDDYFVMGVVNSIMAHIAHPQAIFKGNK